MAKIVIAGKADCPYFAKVELLADSLAKNVPDFKLHKILVQPNDWENWLKQTCEEREWQHSKSPIVWRELVDRGGKGMLVGGANEFQEYAAGYYGVKSDFTSNDMRKIAQENLNLKMEVDEEMREQLAQSKPVHVCISSASSPVCYSMLNAICKGEALSAQTQVSLHLLDNEEKQEALLGVSMEAFDLASSLLKSTSTTSSAKKAFSNSSLIIFLDELCQGEVEMKDEWLRRNYELFVEYGKVINEVGQKDVKIIVAGNGPVNLNAMAIIENAPNIPKENVVAMSRMIENQCKAVLANRLNVNSAGLADVIIWGNVGGSKYIDTSKSRVHGYDGAIWGPPSFSLSAVEMVHDNKWLSTDLSEIVDDRTRHLETEMGHVTSMSQAAAIVTLVNHWWNGSPPGQIFSLGVASQGWYDVPENIVFSFPVTFQSTGSWTIKDDIEITDEVKNKLKDISQELIVELNAAKSPPKPKTPLDETADETQSPQTPPKTPGHAGNGSSSPLEAAPEPGENTSAESHTEDTKDESSD